MLHLEAIAENSWGSEHRADPRLLSLISLGWRCDRPRALIISFRLCDCLQDCLLVLAKCDPLDIRVVQLRLPVLDVLTLL